MLEVDRGGHLKTFSVVAALFLSGCVTIEMPGIVSDMVKAAKDAYNGSTVDKTDSTKTPADTPARPVVAHSYVGTDGQTGAEIKQLCIKEAAQKLKRIAGKELDYLVLKNEVVTFNNNTFANCELGIEARALGKS